MKSVKRALSLLIAAGMCAATLAGCGGGTSSSAASAGSAEGTASGASGEVVQISFPTFMCGTASQTAWAAERIAAFNEEYAGQYEVVVEEIPGDQNYIDKLKVLYSADDLPDVIVTGGYNLIDMFKDKLVDLTPYIEADEEWNAMISDVGRNVNSRDGKLYGIPYIRQTVGYFYNKDLFEQAGIESVPQTWDEFFEACDKLKAAGITPVSMDTADSGWCSGLMLGAAIADAGDAGEEFMNTNQPETYNTPEFIEGATKIQRLFQEYTTTDAIGGDYSVAANNFFNDRTAIIANGPWMVSDFYDTSVAPEGFADKVGVAAFPGNVMYNSGQIGWSIASKTEEKIEASLAFVKFMTSEESQRLDLEMSAAVPDCSIEDADVYPLITETIALADGADRSINDFQSLWHASVVDEISVQFPLLADGTLTPEAFAQALTDAAAT